MSYCCLVLWWREWNGGRQHRCWVNEKKTYWADGQCCCVMLKWREWWWWPSSSYLSYLIMKANKQNKNLEKKYSQTLFQPNNPFTLQSRMEVQKDPTCKSKGSRRLIKKARGVKTTYRKDAAIFLIHSSAYIVDETKKTQLDTKKKVQAPYDH